MYEFSNFRVGFAKRPYNTLNNEYELQANRGCTIFAGISPLAAISLVGEDSTIQAQNYNFIPISDVVKVEPKKTVDVLAVVIVGVLPFVHRSLMSLSRPSKPVAALK